MKIRVQSFENFHPDAKAYRDFLLAQPFYDVRHSDGEVYKHINVRPPDEIAPHLSKCLGKKVTVDLCMARMNFAGEQPNNSVHTDESFSEYAFILFLNLPEQCQGGTAFWNHKKYGWTEFPTDKEILRTGRSTKAIYSMLRTDMNRAESWERIHTEEMAFNKMIVFPCKQWHSRWPWTAWGQDKESARLISVGFFSVE